MLPRLELIRAHHVRRMAAAIAFVIALSAMPGCATSRRAALAPTPPDAALVTSPIAEGAVAMNDFAGWEYGRNDAALNYRPDATRRPDGFTDTITRERFYTFNGRLHENSRYEIRSYRAR